jgi:hypothetical protein
METEALYDNLNKKIDNPLDEQKKKQKPIKQTKATILHPIHKTT